MEIELSYEVFAELCGETFQVSREGVSPVQMELVEVEDLTGDADLSTVNGAIEATFASLGGDQSVKAETVNGRVTINLPENADVKISADTLNGGINGRDFDLEADKGFVGSDLNASIGNGSARLNIDTVNGSIKIRKN